MSGTTTDGHYQTHRLDWPAVCDLTDELIETVRTHGAPLNAPTIEYAAIYLYAFIAGAFRASSADALRSRKVGYFIGEAGDALTLLALQAAHLNEDELAAWEAKARARTLPTPATVS